MRALCAPAEAMLLISHSSFFYRSPTHYPTVIRLHIQARRYVVP